ncbi:MAG: hypothetical protein IJW43_00810 [Clostridia bacterium]|nr:hypothetical protein [Clostridia bacterium]
MAILSCPECGEKISDKAKQCVHCGCELFICKECGNVLTGDSRVCSNCGYELEKSKINTQIIDKKIDDAPKAFEDWKEKESTSKLILFAPIIKIIAIVVALVILVVGIVNLISWADSIGSGDFSFLTTYEDKLSSIKTCIIFFGIILAVGILFGSYHLCIEHTLYGKYLIRKKLKPKELIEKTLNADFPAMEADEVLSCSVGIEETIFSDIHTNDIIERKKTYNSKLVNSVILVVGICLMVIFMVLNVEKYMETLVVYGKEYFEFSMISHWWMLIGGVVLMIIQKIHNKSINKTLENKRDTWAKKNVPELYDVYDVYVKNSDKIIENLFKDLDRE